MLGEGSLFYFFRESDGISARCWIASLSLSLSLSLSHSLSLSLRKIIEDLKNSKDLMAEFIFKKATFHKSCMSLYDKQKLNRKLQTNQDQVDQTPERFFRKTSDFSIDSYKCFFFFTMLQSRMKSFIFVTLSGYEDQKDSP